MDIFAEIASERRELADLLSGFTVEQQRVKSLCENWSVHDVAAHLIVPLEVSTLRFGLTMLVCRGSFDRANERLTGKQALRPLPQIVEVLRLKAETKFTPPGAGPEAPLTDLLVHGSDIRWPLGLDHDIPERRLQTSLRFLTSRAAKGLVVDGVLNVLRFEATDINWSYGNGPVVSGSAEAILLALTGRTAALTKLGGDGLPALKALIK